jgi:hypothetical protein
MARAIEEPILEGDAPVMRTTQRSVSGSFSSTGKLYHLCHVSDPRMLQRLRGRSFPGSIQDVLGSKS